MNRDMQSLLAPASIAVVGASNRPGSVGRAVFSNLILHGYQGVLFPVNPKATSIMGVKAYPDLTRVPDPVDLVVVIVPAASVVEVIEQAGAIGAKGAVVLSAGFKEIGAQGKLLEQQLLAAAKRAGLSLIGPNCLGVINTDPRVSMNATFVSHMPMPGNIAFISQSGALCASVLDVAAARHIGFSKFISFGNKADVTEVDLLAHLKDDPATEVILMYLEDISDGRAFIETASQIAWDRHKPMLALKSGTSPEGARAANSHTGSLAGSDTAYDAIFMQSGIQRVEGINELFHYAQALALQPTPKGKRLAIITNAGGPGIMATDTAIRQGLTLAEFNPATVTELKQKLPPTASVANPVDLIGDANHERYRAALRTVLEDENVDGAVVILTPQAMVDAEATARVVPGAAEGLGKPVLCAFMGVSDVDAGVRHLQRHGIPNYTFPEAAVRAMAAMVRFGERFQPRARWPRLVMADKPTCREVIDRELAQGPRRLLHQHRANRLLTCYGLPILTHAMAVSEDDLTAACQKAGFPLAMKVVSPQIAHKTDAGGVKLNIADLDQARAAFREIMAGARRFDPQAEVEGVYLERMAAPGTEIIIGAVRDPKFGPLVMFGLGGTLVEVLGDVTFRLAPMWEASAENMIRGVKAYKVLEGFRGRPPADLEAIKDCILRVSQMMDENPEIAELDLNPLIAHPKGQGCSVADCRVVLSAAG